MVSTTSLRLYHVSEQPDIEYFMPRPAPSPDSGIQGDIVWAIDDRRLANYLLPRDCPRVTYRAGERTRAADRARFFANSSAEHVIAVEARWFPAIAACRLYLYEMPPSSFELADSIAGYYVSRQSVSPIAMTEVTALIRAILERGVELRFVPELWTLRDALVTSTVEFSIIRMRNSRARE